MNFDLNVEQLQEQIVEAAAEKLIRSDDYYETEIQKRVTKLLQEALDKAVAAKFEEAVQPLLAERVDGLVLQKTNEWGEKTGEPLTFTEYLVKRAEQYLTEKVTYDGKTPDYSSKGTQTRITHMVDRHLHHHIEKAMTEALTKANSQIAQGIYETCRLKLNEILQSVQVNVRTK